MNTKQERYENIITTNKYLILLIPNHKLEEVSFEPEYVIKLRNITYTYNNENYIK